MTTNVTWIEANAGSGKTQRLVFSVLALLIQRSDGTGSIPSIVCITYTRAAAYEMDARIMETLKSWSTMSDDTLVVALKEWNLISHATQRYDFVRTLFTSFLHSRERIFIGTLHAFCERLIRRFSGNSNNGSKKSFTLIGKDYVHYLLRDYQRFVLRHTFKQPDTILAKAITSITRFTHEDGFHVALTCLLENFSHIFYQHDPVVFLNALREAVKDYFPSHIHSSCDPLSYEINNNNNNDNDISFFSCDEYKNIKKRVNLILENRGTYLEHATTSDITFLQKFKDFLLQKNENIDSYKALFTTKNYKIKNKFFTKKLCKRNNDISALEILLTRDVDRLESFFLYRMTALTRDLFIVGYFIWNMFSLYKEKNELFTFYDIIEYCNTLLNNNDYVYLKLLKNIDHILIDEAQDMGKQHWRFVRTLTKGFFLNPDVDDLLSLQKSDKTLLVVGDPKQSIFSFQGADIDNYRDAKAFFQKQTCLCQGKWSEEKLDISFRSAPELLRKIDLIFNAISDTGTDSDMSVHHKAFYQNKEGFLEIWPYQDGENNKMFNDIVYCISHHILTQKIQYKDIFILLRHKKFLTTKLEELLRKHEIPFYRQDDTSIHKNLPIKDILSCANFAFMPYDDFNFSCLFLSPLLSFSHIDLLSLKEIKKTYQLSSLWQTFCTHFLCCTRRHRQCCKHLTLLIQNATLTPYDFFYRLLYNWFAGEKTWNDYISCYQEVFSGLLAHVWNAEKMGFCTLGSYLEFVSKSAGVIQNYGFSAQNSVKIMTVHAAKGLEAEIVFLLDVHHSPSTKHMSPLAKIPFLKTDLPLWLLKKKYQGSFVSLIKDDWYKKELGEHKRILYVALTRAKQGVYVVGQTQEKENSNNLKSQDTWYNIVSNKKY